jgi:hypothetical protein
MSKKTYTVTVNGSSNGNVIAQPFTIEVDAMNYDSNTLIIKTCTKNGSDDVCANDNIASELDFSLPSMSTSKNNDLSNTIEPLLDAAYGVGNWS